MRDLLGPWFFLRADSLSIIILGAVLYAYLIPSFCIIFTKPFRLWKLGVAVIAMMIWLLAGMIGQAMDV
jgi:hypothetical protein